MASSSCHQCNEPTLSQCEECEEYCCQTHWYIYKKDRLCKQCLKVETKEELSREMKIWRILTFTIVSIVMNIHWQLRPKIDLQCYVTAFLVVFASHFLAYNITSWVTGKPSLYERYPEVF